MRVTRGRRRVVASGVCRERAKRAARFGGCERFFGRRSVARSLCPHAHLNSPRLPPRGRPLRLRRRPGRAEGGRRGGGAPHFREQEWTAAAATQREQGVRAGSPPVPHFLFFSPPQRHTMASSALTTADALKQDARRAMVIASDKAKLASLALSRPDSMVRERGGGSSRSLPGAQCPPPVCPTRPHPLYGLPSPTSPAAHARCLRGGAVEPMWARAPATPRTPARAALGHYKKNSTARQQQGPVNLPQPSPSLLPPSPFPLHRTWMSPSSRPPPPPSTSCLRRSTCRVSFFWGGGGREA